MGLRFKEDAAELRGSYHAEEEHSSLPRDIQGSATDASAKGAKICGTQDYAIERIGEDRLCSQLAPNQITWRLQGEYDVARSNGLPSLPTTW